jgi:hypothetical protein
LLTLWNTIRYGADPSDLDTADQRRRLELLGDALDDSILETAHQRITELSEQDSVEGALRTCYSLEEATPLVLLNLIRRRGDRNQLRSGLQQTYGDHTRMLCHSIDKMLMGDVDWLWDRVWQPSDIAYQEIVERVEQIQAIEMTKTDRMKLWIAAALHDYGKLYGRRDGLDPEDAATLVKPIISPWLTETDVQDIQYIIRNHDAVEYVRTGETATSTIANRPNRQPLRVSLLNAYLALIQFCGAASLGEGRIVPSKVDIFDRCLSNQNALPTNTLLRLGLLCGPSDDPIHGFRSAMLYEPYSTIDVSNALSGLLESASLHGWADMRIALHTRATVDDAANGLMVLLSLTADRWLEMNECKHIIFRPAAVDNVISAVSGDHPIQSLQRSRQISELMLRARSVPLLNDTHALILE